MGSDPGHVEVVFFWAFFFFFFLLTSPTLTCTGIILNHKVIRSGRDKERESQQHHLCGKCRNKCDVWGKNQSNGVCESFKMHESAGRCASGRLVAPSTTDETLFGCAYTEKAFDFLSSLGRDDGQLFRVNEQGQPGWQRHQGSDVLAADRSVKRLPRLCIRLGLNFNSVRLDNLGGGEEA